MSAPSTTSQQPAGATLAEPAHGQPTFFSNVSRFLNRRRIAISAAVFVGLIVYDVLIGRKPHNLLDYRDLYSASGLVLVLVGLALRSWAAGILQKGTMLTTSGPYQLIRNPLYVGSFLMMIGFCTVMDDVRSFLVIVGPILIIYLLQVRQEETLLSGRFGGAWQRYASSTPRYFPRSIATNGLADWRQAQWMRSREYRAVGTTLLALVAIQLWYAM